MVVVAEKKSSLLIVGNHNVDLLEDALCIKISCVLPILELICLLTVNGHGKSCHGPWLHVGKRVTYSFAVQQER